MKKLLCLILVMVLVTGGSVYAEVGQPSSWALGVVNAVKNQAILDDDFFSGYQSAITRQEFAYLGVKLYEAYTGQTAEIGTASFLDTSDEWALKAKNVGIVGGYPDGTFLPDKNITREELAVLFVNVFKSAGLEYEEGGSDLFADDSEISSWAKSSVYIARANGIISGVGGNRFDAQGNATKEQSLIMFSNGQSSSTLQVELTDPVPEVPEVAGNVILSANYSSSDQKIVVDFTNLPFDFETEVYAIAEFGAGGTEYDKFPAEIGYIYASREDFQHTDSFENWFLTGDDLTNTYEWSNGKSEIGGRLFYNASGDLIGTLVFHKLSEGENKLEFLMPNEQALADEKVAYDTWKQNQLNAVVDYSMIDTLIYKSRYLQSDYQIFIPNLKSGPYTVSYTIGSNDDNPSIPEYCIPSFSSWVLASYQTNPISFNGYYVSWIGENESDVLSYVGADQYYVYKIETNDTPKLLLGYLDGNEFTESMVKTTASDLYYLKLSVDSMPELEVSDFVSKTLGLRVSYDGITLSNDKSSYKNTLMTSSGASVAWMTYNSSTIIPEDIDDIIAAAEAEGVEANIEFNASLDIYLGPMRLENPDDFTWTITDDGGYDVSVRLIQ